MKAEPEQLARQILRNLKLERKNLPIDVEDICRGYEIKVIHYPFPVELSGLILFKHGHFHIGVNKTHTHERKRFSIAHELGHFFLHKTNFHMDAETSEGSIMFRYRTDPALPFDAREVEANRFAAELLMPAEWFQELWERCRDVDKVSSTFGVSKEAAVNRCRNLELK